MAAFEGAREAAKLEKPHLHRAAGVARYRADRVLNSSGLGGTCAVFVRHNVPGGSNRYTKHGKCPCGPRWVDLPNHHKVAAVECTVKVPMPHLTPNLLARAIRYAFERSRSQAALKTREALYRMMAENASDLGLRGSSTSVARTAPHSTSLRWRRRYATRLS